MADHGHLTEEEVQQLRARIDAERERYAKLERARGIMWRKAVLSHKKLSATLRRRLQKELDELEARK